MGSYHGKFTFLTFSHQKSVLVRDFSGFGNFDFSKFSKLFYSIFSISFMFSNLVSDSCHYLIFSNFLLNQGEMLGASRYPPYSDNKIKTLGFLVKNRLVLIYNLGVIYN